MNKNMYFDKYGNPIEDVKAWDKMFMDLDYRFIGKEKVNGTEVSTIWIGIDTSGISFGADSQPEIFETMVFRDGEGIFEQRYCTLKDAENGHRKIVERVRKGKL